MMPLRPLLTIASSDDLTIDASRCGCKSARLRSLVSISMFTAPMRVPERQPDVALVDVCLEGGREGIEIARWLREVCEVPIVFVTAQNDEAIVERIHEHVPGAPVLSKPVFRHTLAGAVAAVTKH